MHIGRTLPPAAAPIYPKDIVSGLKGLVRGQKELDRFEWELKGYFGIRHCFLVSSGKAALTLTLQALHDIYPYRDEVLIPAYTCYSVPSAITRAGLKTKLCDMNPEALDFDYDKLSQMLSSGYSPSENSTDETPVERAHPVRPHRGSITQLKPLHRTFDRLLAIVPTHLFGQPADMGRILTMVNDPCVTIVEDAAQALGGERDGKKLGTLGHVGFFSLGRGKSFSTVEGGIILTDRDDIADGIRARIREVSCYSFVDLVKMLLNASLLALFTRPSFFWFPKSLPFLRLGETIYDPHFEIRKMSSFQAGLAKNWQARLKNFQKIRDNNAKRWTSTIEKDDRYLLFSENGSETHLIRFPIRIGNARLKEIILKRSQLMGLGIMAAYPDSVAGIHELRGHFRSQDFPVARKCAQELVTLPNHPFVTEKDMERIAKSLSVPALGD